VSGIFWPVFTFGVLIVSLIATIYRLQKIVRLPVHLRWELAPVQHSRRSQLLYMAKEIFFLRGIWQHNRLLWPFSFALHTGIYLIIPMFCFSLVNGLLMIWDIQISFIQTFVLILAFPGYLLGTLGTLGLIVKRVLDSNLRPFSTTTTYFNLLFLALVFISGGYALGGLNRLNGGYFPGFDFEMAYFLNSVITLDTGLALSLWSSIHLIILLLFILYLPFSSMSHFVVKYFLYHAVRWNDKPQDKKMASEVSGLLAQRVSWSAPHVISGVRQNWADIVGAKTNDKKKS
jgi:nitrate reductase gamma subunit